MSSCNYHKSPLGYTHVTAKLNFQYRPTLYYRISFDTCTCSYTMQVVNV